MRRAPNSRPSSGCRSPTQEAADAWALEHTLGLIGEFPLTLGPEIMVVLCSAIATKVSWDPPYELGDRLGTWDVARTLVSARGNDAILATPLGDVAVHAKFADGLTVTSVVAPAGVADVDVLDLAHTIATDRAAFPRRSLFALPLGAHELWTVTERDGVAGRERFRAELPAWEAHSSHALLADPRTGFPAAARTVAGLLGGAGPADAKQMAIARYTRVGFEAAAVTATAVGVSAMVRTEGRERAATLHFAHPFAVVATAAASRRHDSPAWTGLPVFAAWVERAIEARD